MMPDKVESSHPSLIEIDTVCELCGKDHRQVVDVSAGTWPPCPYCEASFADRALAVTLMGYLSDQGAVRFDSFVEEKSRRGLIFGSFGRAFSVPGLDARLIDCAFRSNLRDIIRQRRKSGDLLQVPLQDHVLDVLLIETPAALALGLAELKRVVKLGGLIILSGGVEWPLPPVSSGLTPQRVPTPDSWPILGADLPDRARDAGMIAFYDRPGAGYSVVESHTLLVMFPLPSPADE